MTTFTEKFKIKALEDRLPFGLDFEIKQVTSSVTQDVCGFTLPVLNDITSGESWFFESLDFQNSGRTQELALSLRSLAKKLQIACEFKSLSEASSALFEPTEELLATKAYEQFVEENYIEIDRITALSRLLQDSTTLDWLRVTFFMLSRFSGEWSLADTSMLTKEIIGRILDFIKKEVNKGIEIPESPADEDNQEDEGKRAKKPVGRKSTGN